MKKITTILLLASMLASLAACASDTQQTDGTTDAGTVDTTAAETTVFSEYTAPDADYDGAEFVIAANNWLDNRFWKIEIYCEMFASEENGDPINDAIYTRNRTVEEELNVKLGIFDIPNMKSNLTVLTQNIMAGDDVFKVAAPTGDGLPMLFSTKGMLTDLADITVLDTDASWWHRNSVEEFSIYGTSYAMTGDLNMFNKGAPICNFFSKKMVEDLNLENPYQLVYDGKWTLDEMFKMASASARDLNGDGQMVPEDDVWGIMFEPSSLIQYILSSDIRMSERDENGDISISVNTEKTASVIEKAVTFLTDRNTNIMSSDYESKYKNIFSELFLKKFIDNGAMFFSNQILVALDLRDMEADFGILPMPKYNEAQDGYLSSLNNAWCTFTTVPVTNGELEMTGHVLNAMGYYSQQYVTPAFIDNTVKGKAIRDDDSAEMLQIIYDNQVFDIAQYYNWGAITGIFTSMISARSTDFASFYAVRESSVNSELKSTLSQLR